MSKGWPREADGLPNPKQKYGDKKLPVHLVPPALVLGAARALGEGAVKYNPYNFRKDMVESMTYAGAILRHILAWIDGEDLDPESEYPGKTHLDGVAGSLAILMDAMYSGNVIDNRPPPGPGAAMVRTPEPTPKPGEAIRMSQEQFDKMRGMAPHESVAYLQGLGQWKG